jgi:hypothetical protein
MLDISKVFDGDVDVLSAIVELDLGLLTPHRTVESRDHAAEPLICPAFHCYFVTDTHVFALS